MSVVSPSQATAIPQTLSIRSRRSRLLTSAAVRLRSTDFPRLPHCLGRFAPCGFSRPPALRRADYRLPPVIVLPLWMFMLLLVVVVFAGETNRGTGAGVVFLLLVLLLYMEI